MIGPGESRHARFEDDVECSGDDDEPELTQPVLLYELKPMTEAHKQMCGCETCLTPDSLQKSLNAVRVRIKRELYAKANALPAGGGKPAKARKAAANLAAANYQPTLDYSPAIPWHSKPGLALGEIQCQSCPGGGGFPHWDCVLRRCTKCPDYPIPPEEQGTDENAPTIFFHVYETVMRCTKHGVITPGTKVCEHCKADPTSSDQSAKNAPKVRSRKHLTLINCAIGTFHQEYYLPALEKLAYHRPHCRILGKEKCGAARLAAFKSHPSVRTRRDYAERLAAAFNLEAQHEHFGTVAR